MKTNFYQGIAISLLSCISLTSFALPPGFVYLDTIDASIIQSIGSATSHNITGAPLPGYKSSRCIVTRPAALALSRVQQTLKVKGFALKIFEAYQPQQAVDYLVQWGKDPKDSPMKNLYYPNIDKIDLIKLYDIGQLQSRHSRGSTVAVTLVALSPKGVPLQEVDMGTAYHCADPKSLEDCYRFNASKNEDSTIVLNRLCLQMVMSHAGFSSYKKGAWWQFTLEDEPFADTHFDFVVE